jgi:uncharacterized protein YoxC
MEYIIGFAFVGVFSMLSITMGYMYLLSKKLTEVTKRVETIETVVNVNTNNTTQVIDRLNKLKQLIEEWPSKEASLQSLHQHSSNRAANAIF